MKGKPQAVRKKTTHRRPCTPDRRGATIGQAAIAAIAPEPEFLLPTP